MQSNAEGVVKVLQREHGAIVADGRRYGNIDVIGQGGGLDAQPTGDCLRCPSDSAEHENRDAGCCSLYWLQEIISTTDGLCFIVMICYMDT